MSLFWVNQTLNFSNFLFKGLIFNKTNHPLIVYRIPWWKVLQNIACPDIEAATGRALKFRKIHRETPLPDSIFNKVAGLQLKRLWHKCFPVNFAKFSRALFLQNTFGRLLLQIIPALPNQSQEIKNMFRESGEETKAINLFQN